MQSLFNFINDNPIVKPLIVVAALIVAVVVLIKLPWYALVGFAVAVLAGFGAWKWLSKKYL